VSRERSLLGRGAALVPGLGAGGVVVVLLAGGLVFGLRNGGDGKPDPPASSGEPAEKAESSARESTDPASAALPELGPELTIAAGKPAAVVDRLPVRAVLVINASGFEPGSKGHVAQCAFEDGNPGVCANRFPVQFDDAGTARFQYGVTDRLRPAGRCGPDDPACLVIVSGGSPEVSAEAFTVFGGAAPPPGRVEIEPVSGLSDGDVVAIRAEGFPAATRLVATQCPPSSGSGPSGCRGTAPGRTGPDGRAVLHLTVKAAQVEAAACAARRSCVIRVTADAPVVPVSVPFAFSTGPPARYDSGRVGAGLALAVLLLGLAWRLVRTTDWRGPAEAATPEMDGAILES
jgi:hypothetical protein